MEVAQLPYLDAVAAGGLNGLLDVVDAGLACSSHRALLSLLGYDVCGDSRGPGALDSKQPSFEAKHGMRFRIFASANHTAGLHASLGRDLDSVPGDPSICSSALHATAAAACDALTGSDCDFALVHVSAVHDAGRERRAPMKVRTLEVVDRMLGQILRRLSDNEASHPVNRYCVVVTGDHSTPVMYGEVSYEPVPFAIAHVRHAVEALGGASTLRAARLVPLPLPDGGTLPTVEQLGQQATWEDARRKSSWAGRPWDPMMPPELFGPGRVPWPQAVRGDAVRCFDEVSVARGALGRFTGAGVMPLVKQYGGWDSQLIVSS